MSVMTIFTAPKPFTNPHIAAIQRNAIASWKALGPEVRVVVVGQEDGLAEAAAELGVPHLPAVRRNALGTPLVSSIFELGRQAGDSPLLAYVNADILLMPDFVEAARKAQAQARNFLLVGQRWDLEVTERLTFEAGWPAALRRRAQEQGKLHRASGSDYFVFPRECFSDMPDFAIGRAGWDNWMLFKGRWEGWPVVDCSDEIMIVHQNHDYSHLPGGQTHYRLPETFENVRLAGGKRAIFELRDADRRMMAGKLVGQPFSRARLARELEIFPLVKLHSFALGQAAYALFHPKKAYRDWRKQITELS